jgi:hypothetical protein
MQVEERGITGGHSDIEAMVTYRSRLRSSHDTANKLK